MRSQADTRNLASMELPSGFAFFVNSDHAELVTPEGDVVRFSEGYTVAEVERVAWSRKADRANSEHELMEIHMDRLNLEEFERVEYRERLGTLKIMSLCNSLDIMLAGEAEEKEEGRLA